MPSPTALAFALGLFGAGSSVSVHATATTLAPDFVCPSLIGIWNRVGHAQIAFGALSIAVIAVLCETAMQASLDAH